jgi:diguanylate cyclase (GGDEF)-like protein
MRGMIVRADISYDLAVVWAGIAAATMFFVSANWIFARTRHDRRIVFPAIAAILGICTLHFSAMSGTVMTPVEAAITGPSVDSISDTWLAVAITGIMTLVLTTAVVAAIIDRYLVDLRGLADSTLDGIAIDRNDRIIEVNTRFLTLLDCDEASCIGRSPDCFLLAADDLPPNHSRKVSVEATPLRGERARIFELAAHKIEYRGRLCDVIAIRDLTEKRAAQRKLEYLARHDVLTGLANRATMAERLGTRLNELDGNPETFAVLALDLDRFKAVNDLFGHAEGDRILKEVSRILGRCVGSGDLVARLGGDEFAILCKSSTTKEDARNLAKSILEQFAQEMDLKTNPTAVGVTIGVSMFPEDGDTPEKLMQAADLALYRAKTKGRGQAAFHDEKMDRDNRERRQLEGDLAAAMRTNQLELVYQPVRQVKTGSVKALEALVRWNHPTRGPIDPEVFIPIAEDAGIIIALGEWVLGEACQTAADWEGDCKVAVNISPAQFRLGNLTHVVTRALQMSGLSPKRLQLEITEAAMLRERDAVLKTLFELRALGVGVVLDDFGTGASSLQNLHSFPFDKIKVDRSFIAAMETDKSARAIVRAVTGLGRSLDLPVVAEGIETPEQYQLAIEEGCLEAQGYLLGPPQKISSRRLNRPALSG